MITNTVSNVNSQCQVVFFNWTTKIPNRAATISQMIDSNPLDISKYVRTVSFSKNLSSPAGTFEIVLPNDRDWKDILQRGTWGVIYMSQNGGLDIPKTSDTPSMTSLANQNSHIRGIVLIDRVGVRGTIVDNERGAYDADFVVTGRDFGVVYAESNIFFNKLYSEGVWQETVSAQLNSSTSRNVADLITIFHKAFLSPQDLAPGAILNEGSLLKNMPVQWLMPQKLFQVLGAKPKHGVPYYGNIPNLLQFDKTLCSYPISNPFTLTNGNAWERLKSVSIQEIHELFAETDELGNPHLYFRYIPWKTSSGRRLGKLNSLVTAFTDLPRVLITSPYLIEFELGEDTHSRYNYFLLTVENGITTEQDTINLFTDRNPSTGFPRIEPNSIRRYGLRLFYRMIDALIIQGAEKVDPGLLMLHNELMVEYHNNEIFMENGTVTIIGNPTVKLGMVLEFDSAVPYNGGKLFYIEGYTDSFISDDKGAGSWTQTLTVTRGIYPRKISQRGQPYNDNGEFTGN